MLRHTAIAAACGLLTAPALEAQPVIRVGVEFQVNTFTTGPQVNPDLAVEDDGDFVVVWTSRSGQDGNDYGVFAQRFDSNGSPLAAEFQVNSYTSYRQLYPAVAIAGDGDFVVVWASFQDGFDYGIFARRFSSTGSALASEFQVNVYTPQAQYVPSVAARLDGGFVVVWQSNTQDGNGYGIFARRFDSTGSPLASEFQVNSQTAGTQKYPDLAIEADGDFVIAWQGEPGDGSGLGVFARRFDSGGAAQAVEFQVNTYTSSQQTYPAIGVDGDGDFVVTWQSFGEDGAGYGVFARRFSSAGSPQASEFQVNDYTADAQHYPALAMESDGDFVIAWHSIAQGFGVFARRFDSAGGALAAEFQVNTFTPGGYPPAVGGTANGAFVISWSSYYRDGDKTGVFGQRFATSAVLDVDGNGATGALTDGLLVLRHLFGFTGATLISGATAGNCSRCDAPTIASYLTGLGSVLDVDGDGSLGALTDGLLALRFLFGFTGATLINGAVNTNGCTRCTAPAIEAYLGTLI